MKIIRLIKTSPAMLYSAGRGPVRKLARLTGVLFALAFLAGCSMVDSSVILTDDSEGCSGDSGAYYLSRTVLHVVVEESDGETNKQVKLKLGIAREPDRNRGFCLDFLASPTAEEAVFVQKTSNHLLSKVTTDSRDRSAAIAKSLIKIAEVLLTGSPGLARTTRSTAKLPQVFSARYDPFNVAQTALVNEQLRNHDICLIVEGAVDGTDLNSIGDYCDNPLRDQKVEAAIQDASKYTGRGNFVNYTKGLLYRPRLPYNYFIYYKKPNPRTRKIGWTLAETKTISFENKSPIISLGIDRAYFAHRKTTVLFDDGVLHDVDIAKGSELAGAVEIPISIANSLVAAPAKIVQLRFDNTTRRSNLINAQGALLQNQRILNLSKREARGAPNGQLPDSGGSARGFRLNQGQQQAKPQREALFTGNIDQCVSSCLGSYTDTTACNKYCECKTTGNSWLPVDARENFCASSLKLARKKQ